MQYIANQKVYRQADKTKYENLRTGISKSFKRALEKYNYRDIEAYNFNDDNDENVSFVLAQKYINGQGYRCIIVIRGTDGIEWEGNMKVCPPDEKGNTDKYTFTNSDDTHYNFLQASKYIENGLNEYLKKYSLNNENTTVVLTGHSRGGAVSNLAAKSLSDNVGFVPSVTAYTYATPNVSPYTSDMEYYTNIFNYCKADDFIPCIPLTNNAWNYWKYGNTYIEKKYDRNGKEINSSYCNEITSLMSQDRYANTLENYYNKKFVNKDNESDVISLYNFMIDGLAKPMSNNMNILVKGISAINSIRNIKNKYKGMSELCNIISKNIVDIGVNHSSSQYESLLQSHYKEYTYSDALSRCIVGGNDATVQSLMAYATNSIYLADDDSTDNTYNLVETSKIKSFLSNADDDGVTNADKLGWDIDDYTTWNGVFLARTAELHRLTLCLRIYTAVLICRALPHLKVLTFLQIIYPL